ncbi:hypothetical protein [Cellulophaga sp. Hel_I_12]|uniref:hypothetical protein n=1 Tax=Cellulophaga sp. Hel_I_12 TaxID=1249972 RepID=UPI00064802A7|nr:hypothetical protein [Cellulophaga sp. Hel_I_12]
MGYKIFYSFQTDTDSKLNLGFIRKAIEKAIKNIKEFDIDPLLEGFRGVGGNAPLLETMLKQSAKADVFIGDITYTSSKIWQSKGVSFFEDGKQYFIEIDKTIELKPAPNPNVLIETGYSWGIKNFERTILVMNTAFGDPSLLPVDMKGLRYPISYNLSEKRFSQSHIKVEELKVLTKALEGAIRTAINSTIEHQKNILSPLQPYYEWERESRILFILTKKTEIILSEIRARVIQDNKPLRIVGPLKSGKSRILFEIFRKNGSLDAMPEQLNRIIYHNFDGATGGDISKQIHLLRSLDQSKILILDNCPNNNIQAFEDHFNETNIKLITLSNTSQQVYNEYEISKDDTIEISKEILLTKFGYNKAEELANELGGDIRKVIQNLSNNVSLEGQTSSLELIKQELGEGNVKNGGMELLTNISLFKFLGAQSMFNHEICCFIDAFYPGSRLDEIYEIIEILIKHNLVVRRGDFIEVVVDNEELIYDWWKNLDSVKIDAIHILDNKSLLDKFSKQLIRAHKNIPIPNLENNLFGPAKFFRKGDYYLTHQGQRFLNNLVPVFPEKVLELSEEIVKYILK